MDISQRKIALQSIKSQKFLHKMELTNILKIKRKEFNQLIVTHPK